MCVRVCACVCVYRPRGAACLAPLRTAQAFGIAPDMHAGRRFLAGAASLPLVARRYALYRRAGRQRPGRGTVVSTRAAESFAEYYARRQAAEAGPGAGAGSRGAASGLSLGEVADPASDKSAPRWRKNTKQIATVGPASSSLEVLEKLFRAGVDVFRLNFSHGEHAEKAALVAIIREIEKKYQHPIGILADLQGPKLRVGKFANGPVTLQTGQEFTFDLDVDRHKF